MKIAIDGENVLTLSEENVVTLTGESANWFKNLATGTVIDYFIEGSHIAVDIGAQILPIRLLGTCHLTYEYKSNQLIVNRIGFHI